MNKIVREHYPVERLPVDLRQLAGTSLTVTLTIEAEDSGRSSQSTSEILAEMRTARENLSIPRDHDPVARIRKLRDEWED